MESGVPSGSLVWLHLVGALTASCTLDGPLGDSADAAQVRNAPAAGGATSSSSGNGGTRAVANETGPDASGTAGSSGNANGSTGGTSSGVDAGAAKLDATTSLADATIDYNTPLVCTSGDHWTGGDRGAASMHPGEACIACHTAKQGPAFSAAGTVYPTAHEPDNCNGLDGLFAGATVHITGADGQTVSMLVSYSGNFNFAANTKIVPPFRAKVVVAGRERAMMTPQAIGDCNLCHTVTGKNGAPGRVVAP